MKPLWQKFQAFLSGQVDDLGREPLAETLESRVLYSAAPVASPVVVEHLVVDEAFSAESSSDSIGYNFSSIGYNSVEESGAHGATVRVLNADQLDWLVDAAVARWEQAGLSDEQLAALGEISYEIVDLDGPALGYAEGSRVIMDADAAGSGWYIDLTPADDTEFTGATHGSVEGMDLLSVLVHEMGHVIGLADVYDAERVSDVMYGLFETGERRSIDSGRAEGAEAFSLLGRHFAAANVDTGNGIVDVTGDATDVSTFTEVAGNLFLNGVDLGIATSAVTQLNYIGSGAANDVVRFEGTLNFGDTAIDIGSTVSGGGSAGVLEIDFRGHVNLTGNGSFTGVAHRTIEFDPDDILATTSGITTENGNISLTAIRDDSDGDGIRTREGTTTLQSITGDIYLEGEANGPGSFTKGVFLGNNGTATIQTSGDITIVGRSAGDDDSNIGVHLLATASVQTTGSGSISINGTGGGGNVDNDGDGHTSNGGIIIEGQLSSQSGGITLVGVGGSGLGDSAAGNDGVYLVGASAVIQSSGGLISITGTGGQTATTGGISDSNRGVYIDEGSIVATGNASIRIEGIGGVGNSGNRGVDIDHEGQSISAVNGDITIIGTGGTGNTPSAIANEGVRLSDEITVTGTGNIIIQGTGGTGGFDINNHGNHRGINFNDIDAVLSTTSGSITLTGAGGTATDSDQNDGVHFGSTGDRLVSTSGTITINGSAGSGRGESRGVHLTVDTVISTGGDVSITGFGGLNDESGGVPTIAAVNNIGVDVVGNIAVTGSGNLTITGTGGEGDGGLRGVEIDNSVSVENGVLTIIGQGGTGITATGTSNEGVRFNAAVNATGSGRVVVQGTGGTSGFDTANNNGNNRGVFFNTSSATITTTSGSIRITGVGGANVDSDDNNGVHFGSTGDRLVSSTGDIIVNGTGGNGRNGNKGINLSSGAILRTGGDISITGVGGNNNETGGVPTGAADNNIGIELDGIVTTTGAGTITVNGTGGRGDSDQHGIEMDSDTAAIRSVDGAISFIGIGGVPVAASGGKEANQGIRLNLGSIRTSGAGTISLSGTGGDGEEFHHGVVIGGDGGDTFLLESLGTGSISVVGSGGGNIVGAEESAGVYVADGGRIRSSTAAISITGTGGTGSNARGVVFTTGGNLLSTSGDVSIVGNGNGSDDSDGIQFSGGQVSSGGGALTLRGIASGTGEGIQMSSASDVVGGGTQTGAIDLITDKYSGSFGQVQTTGDINFTSVTAGRAIFVGVNDDLAEDSSDVEQSSGLEIADDELVNIADGFGNLNFTSTGDITVDIHGKTADAVQNGGTVSIGSLDVDSVVTVGGQSYRVREESPNFDIQEVIELDLSANQSTVEETQSGANSFSFTVTRSGSTKGTTAVNYLVTSAAADAADFGGTMPSGTVTFAPTETVKTITIDVFGDRDVELDEVFTVTLSGQVDTFSTAIDYQSSTANSTIVNDDIDLTLSPGSLSLSEGASGSTSYLYTVTRSGATDGVSTVNYAVTGSGANPADNSDVIGTLPSGTITFNAGETVKTIEIAVSGDLDIEPDEAFTLTLSGAADSIGAHAVDVPVTSVVSTIQNDDTPIAHLTVVTDGIDPLGSGGVATDIVFAVDLRNASGQALVNDTGSAITFVLTDLGTGTATAGSDYGSLPATISIADGASVGTVTIPVVDDGDAEPTETVVAQISSPSLGVIGTAIATADIVDIKGQSNVAPVANDDENFAIESGGFGNSSLGSSATGNTMGGVGVSASDVADTDADATDDPSAGDGSVVVTSIAYTGTPFLGSSHLGGSVSSLSTSANGTQVDGAYGTLTIGADGSYEYQVNEAVADFLNTGDTATDTFTYTISDGVSSGVSASLTIHVQGQNDDPTPSPISATTYEDGNGGDTAASGNAIAVTADSDDANTALSITSIEGQPVNSMAATRVESTYGAIEIDASGAWLYTLDSELPQVQALATGQVATEVFHFEVSDGSGGVSSSTISIQVVGEDEPTAEGTETETGPANVIDSSLHGIFHDLPVDLMFAGFRIDWTAPKEGFQTKPTLTPFFAGQSIPGATVEVIIRDSVGNELSGGSTYADPAGNWSMAVSADVHQGSRYTLEVRQLPNFWSELRDGGMYLESRFLEFKAGLRAESSQFDGLGFGDIIGEITEALTLEEFVAFLAVA